MKLFRYGLKGQEKPGILLDGEHFDVSGFGEDYTNDFLANNGLNRLRSYVEENRNQLVPVPENVRIGCPLANPAKIICTGLNYYDHAVETGFSTESEPILFLKAISALNGPFDGITIPKTSTQPDWETELAIVIGKNCTNINPDEYHNIIAGYVLINDVSDRAFMKHRGGTWDKGKGANTFAPVGPYFVTADEIPDVNNLHIWLKLNGQLMQDSNTSQFIYKPDFLVSYTSEFFGLNAGDIIATGSPAGTGIGQNPQRFLKPGDIIEYGIEHLGVAKQLITAYK